MCVKSITVDAARRLKLDPLAELTVSYTIDGFNELVEDIRKNGLLVPIVLRDGKVLDGRHRLKACLLLGIDVNRKEVGLIPHDEAVDLVISNAICKATSTDAAKVEAYLLCAIKRIAVKDMPDKFNRLNANTIKKIRYIEKVNPEYLKVILNQNKVTLYNKEFNKIEDYGTIHSLYKTLKGNKKFECKIIEVEAVTEQSPEYTVDVEEYFDNPVAEDEYWELFNIGKDAGANLHPATELGRKVASLVKSKYL